MGTIEGLYGACSEIEVALDCLFRKQGYRPAYADNALAKIRAGIGDGIFSIRPEPRQASGEVEALQHLDAIIGLCDGTRGPEDLDSDPFETIGRHAEKARALLARKGE